MPSARLLDPIPTACANGLLLDFLGRLANDDDLVSSLECRHGRIVETAKSLVADYRYHPFSVDLTGRVTDLVLGHRSLAYFETFIAGEQVLDDRSEVRAHRRKAEQPPTASEDVTTAFAPD